MYGQFSPKRTDPQKVAQTSKSSPNCEKIAHLVTLLKWRAGLARARCFVGAPFNCKARPKGEKSWVSGAPDILIAALSAHYYYENHKEGTF